MYVPCSQYQSDRDVSSQAGSRPMVVMGFLSVDGLTGPSPAPPPPGGAGFGSGQSGSEKSMPQSGQRSSPLLMAAWGQSSGSWVNPGCIPTIEYAIRADGLRVASTSA